MMSPGLGTWKIPNETTAGVVEMALRMGYRHLDCAADYGNEQEVGEGMKAAFDAGVVRRDDVFVTSKLWNTDHRPEHVRGACEKSLRDLGLEELDLYLIHFPISLAHVPATERYPAGWFRNDRDTEMTVDFVPYLETWAAMEELVEAGLVKSIGVSNIGTAMLREVLGAARVKPANLQVELHPFLTQDKLVRFCQENDVSVTAFSPFGADSYLSLGMAEESERLLDHSVVTSVAQEVGKTPGQVLLRWASQRGTVPIPKSQSEAHLRENLASQDFDLNDQQMAAIFGLNCGRRFNDPGEFCEQAFGTFFPVYD